MLILGLLFFGIFPMDILGFLSRFPRPLRSWRLLVVLFLYRLVLCLTVRTAESPDEWWQSEEVAYHMVFGRGQLTWEWDSGIRSYVFPLFYAVPLFLLKWTGTDSAVAVWASSRCVQAVIFFAHDCATLALAQRLDQLSRKARKVAAAPSSGEGVDEATSSSSSSRTAPASATRVPTVASATLAMLVVGFFLNYDGVRCYSNVAESLFFLLALHSLSFRGFLFWAGVACAVRVTAVFAVLPVFALHVYQICRRKGVVRGLMYIFLVTVGMVASIGAAVCLVDFLFYKRLVITPLRFLQFNILMDVSKYYGTHPAYWYVVLLPVLIAPFSAFLLWMPAAWRQLVRDEKAAAAAAPPAPPQAPRGSTAVPAQAQHNTVRLAAPAAPVSRPRTVRREIRRWLIVMAFTLLCHSAVAHKEMRFVYLLLPLLLILSSFVVAQLTSSSAVAAAPARRGGAARYIPSAYVVRRLFTLCWLVSALLSVALLFAYRRGGPSMLREVRNGSRHYTHLEVLTHCYATPGFAHIHGKVDRFETVDCPMKLDPVTLVREVTQDRLFTEQPRAYALWRYLRQASPLTFAKTDADGNEDGKLSRGEWWREVVRLMPAAEAPAIPDGIIVFRDTAKALEADLLLPLQFRLEAAVAHAPHSFEPNEDRTIELWVRDAATADV